MGSVCSSRGTHASSLVPLLLALEFQQLLNDVVGVHLQMIIEMVLHLEFEVIVIGSDLEVALD
jgi:hypothetical protein